MCRLITNERHCENCDEIVAPHLVHCNSLTSCTLFRRFAQFHGTTAEEAVAKLAEREAEEKTMQAVAVLCKNIEDGKRKVSPEDAEVLKAAGWIVVDTTVWEEVLERARRLGLLVVEEEEVDSEEKGQGG